jgi:hypothetical protein
MGVKDQEVKPPPKRAVNSDEKLTLTAAPTDPALLVRSGDGWYLYGSGSAAKMEMMLNAKRWIAKLAEFYKADGRRHLRLPAEFGASIAGSFGTVHVTGVDANRGGAGVQSPEALPLGTLVFLRITSLGLMGFAHVRHCSPRGEGYLLGLEFRDGLSRERDEAGNWNWQQFSQAGRRLWDEAEA